MENSNTVHQSTYQYKEPFRFMGEEYTDSRSLAEAFIENWDIAISVFRRAGMGGFWKEGEFWKEYIKEDGQSKSLSEVDAFFHEKYSQIWFEWPEWPAHSFADWHDDTDALFPVILHKIEPALGKIPFIRAEDDEARLYSFEEFGDWILSLVDGNQWRIYDENDYHYFDEWELDMDTLNRTLVEYAAKHRMFSTYAPGTKEAEEKFLKADKEQKCGCLKELALKLVKITL